MKAFRSYPMAFHGRGSEYFKILLVNTLLTVVTLGLYYPWAKEHKLKYLYSKNTFEETPFVFSGTGKEMFKGFIKAFGILILLYAAFLYLYLNGSVVTALLLLYGSLIAIIPVALHGAYRYRMAKTTWKGIRFGYTGDRGQLVGLFVKGLLLTLVTFGLYSAWFTVSLRRYIISNIHVGNARFVYDAEGADYFWMNVKGYILTVLTLGIYMFWWQKDQFEFFINNTRLEQDEDAVFFHSKATGGGFASLMILNFLILIFTFGLGYAWTVTRTMTFVMNNIEASGYYSFESLVQSQHDYSDATAEDMADVLDIGMI
ncbi:MAG: YjgN family protein [Bacteroidota bacterium]|nr:YjgN family protein [Bacteroidota bacterium]